MPEPVSKSDKKNTRAMAKKMMTLYLRELILSAKEGGEEDPKCILEGVSRLLNNESGEEVAGGRLTMPFGSHRCKNKDFLHDRHRAHSYL